MEALLSKLTHAYGLSGREDCVANIVRDNFEEMGYAPELDVMGNVFGFGASSNNPVMIFAHTDEIGLMVQRISDTGLIYFKKIGGFANTTICNMPVDIPLKDRLLKGVVGLKPPHLMEDAEMKASPKTEDLYVDIGATSKIQVLDYGIKPGTSMYFPRFFQVNRSRVLANALDDRAGVTVMLKAMEELADLQVIGVGTVQEEVGLRGARTSIDNYHPRAAIVLDVTFDSSQPGVLPHQCTAKMGEGPVISLSSRGMQMSHRMENLVAKVAKQLDIPVQWEITTGGGTDADLIHIMNGGIPTILMSIPNRYMHSTVEVCDLADMQQCAKLVEGLVRELQ